MSYRRALGKEKLMEVVDVFKEEESPFIFMALVFLSLRTEAGIFSEVIHLNSSVRKTRGSRLTPLDMTQLFLPMYL